MIHSRQRLRMRDRSGGGGDRENDSPVRKSKKSKKRKADYNEHSSEDEQRNEERVRRKKVRHKKHVKRQKDGHHEGKVRKKGGEYENYKQRKDDKCEDRMRKKADKHEKQKRRKNYKCEGHVRRKDEHEYIRRKDAEHENNMRRKDNRHKDDVRRKDDEHIGRKDSRSEEYTCRKDHYDRTKRNNHQEPEVKDRKGTQNQQRRTAIDKQKELRANSKRNYCLVDKGYEQSSDISVYESHVSSNHNNDPQSEERQHKPPEKEAASSKMKIDSINLKTGGAYIPPAKLKMMQERIVDKSSIEYQRLAWEALKKSLTGLINRVNSSNIAQIVHEIFKENVIRGRGVLARTVMQAQAMSPVLTPVYAALVAVINSMFPNISELILKRLIIQFKKGFRRNDKQACVSSTRFIAHLLNQQVAHVVVILQVLALLLKNPTNDSVEISIFILKECGQKLTVLCKKVFVSIFKKLKSILHEAAIDKRVQFMIEVLFTVRKDKFKDHIAIPEGLDLVEEEDKFTHLITLEDATDAEEILNVFQFDPEYLKNEDYYKNILKEILAEDSDSSSESDYDGESGSEKEEGEKTADGTMVIHDTTEASLVAARRNIYLTIQSSLDFEECAYKLLKMELNPGQIVEMCYMILDCCTQQRKYKKFFGLLAQRFCQLNKIYVESFTKMFKNSYETIHRLETNKLRNVAKFFAHLLCTDAISWMVLANIKLNEDDTTSSNRIFIKILFQDLSEYMGLTKVFERLKDVDELREHLKTVPKSNSIVIEDPVQERSSSSSDESDDGQKKYPLMLCQ